MFLYNKKHFNRLRYLHHEGEGITLHRAKPTSSSHHKGLFIFSFWISRASAVLCYVWTYYLGKRAVLAREHDVTPKVVYAAYSRVERNGGLDAEGRERWYR